MVLNKFVFFAQMFTQCITLDHKKLQIVFSYVSVDIFRHVCVTSITEKFGKLLKIVFMAPNR